MKKKDKPDSENRNKCATNSIHGGIGFNENTGAVTSPIFMTSTFKKGNKLNFDYTRSGNPNFLDLESVIRKLEHGKYATVFSSGVAAITAIVANLKSDDLILAEENIYGCTFRLFAQVFKKFGLKVKYIDFSEQKSIETIKQLSPIMVWIESPTNPLLKILDIRNIAENCKESGAILVVDNTFASSYYQKPLDLGADLSLSSSTKYINGHSDSLGGVVCTNDKEWNDKLIFSQKALGLNPSPFDAWLITRGVKTLSIRMEAHTKNAIAFAEYLEDHPQVKWVRYPTLSSHPQFELAKKQMSGGSGIVTANLGLTAEKTLEFIGKLKMFTLAESLGGVESLVSHPATMSHATIPEEERLKVGITDSVVRFSLGIEDIEDLIKDIEENL